MPRQKNVGEDPRPSIVRRWKELNIRTLMLGHKDHLLEIPVVLLSYDPLKFKNPPSCIHNPTSPPQSGHVIAIGSIWTERA